MTTNTTDCSAMVDAALERWQHRPEPGTISDEETSHAAAEILNDLAGLLCHAMAHHHTLEGVFSEQDRKQINIAMDEAARRLLNAAMAGHPLPGAEILLNSDGDTLLRLAKYDITVFFDGWRPLFQGDAGRLRNQVLSIWAAGAQLERAIALNRRMRTVTLLLDSRPHMIQTMEDVKSRVAGADPLLTAFENPANWAGPVPAEARLQRVDIQSFETEDE
jgi:hypothetical protein